MARYQDIILLPDPEFSNSVLMNALFAKLHRVLVQLQSTAIGISFPHVDNDKPSLGSVLRLHGTDKALQSLEQRNWLSGMYDHIEISDIAPVPSNTQHCRVKRVQAKSNVERLRRRYRKRRPGVNHRDAIGLIPASVEKHLALPYLQLKSESTGQRFLLFIHHQPPQANPIEGTFNRYGLSRGATVPWF